MPTLINTLGAADANSFVATVAEATALLDHELIARSAWDAADDEERSKALITAARQLNLIIDWRGTPRTTTQAMAWPRYDYVAYGGVKYGPDADLIDFPATWPALLPKAQAMLAAHLLERKASGSVMGGVDTSGTIKRMKAGSVELEYRDGATFVAGYSIPDEIFAMLAPWGDRIDRQQDQTLLTR